MGPGGVNDAMHRKRGLLRIWGIWENSVSWVFASEEEGWLSELAEALRRVSHVVGGRWKSQQRKIVYLSPYVEKPFNSKVIKSFVPELRSRKCFCVSRFLCALWTFYIYLTYSWMAMLQNDTRLETQINYIMIWAPPVMQWLTCLAKEFDSHASHTFSFVLNKGIIALWLFHTSQKHSAQMQSDWNDLFFFLPLGRTQVY